ncbi:MAG: hypothetical protein U0625_12075 [Phycisphaerales bacterium]
MAWTKDGGARNRARAMAMASLAAALVAACGRTAMAELVGTGGAASGTGAPALMLTEIRVDQSGADNDEYFEVCGSAGASLAGWWFIALGDSASDPAGVVEMAVDLSAHSLGSNGYFVGHEATFGNTSFAGQTLSIAAGGAHATIGTGDSLNFENADTVTYLLVRGFTGTVGMDLDAGNDGTLDALPWLELADAVAFVRTASTDPVYASAQVGPIDLTATSGMPPHAWRDETGWHAGLYGAWDPDTPGSGVFVPGPGAAALLLGAVGRAHGYHRRRRE